MSQAKLCTLYDQGVGLFFCEAYDLRGSIDYYYSSESPKTLGVIIAGHLQSHEEKHGLN